MKNCATRKAKRHPLKISVIKITKSVELFPELPEGCVEGMKHECPRFQEGQVFYIDAEGNCEPDFPCAWAWNDNYSIITVMQNGGHFCEKRAGVQYTCCTDGLRPVIFKVEWFDEAGLPTPENK